MNQAPRGTRSSRNPAHLSRKPGGSEQSPLEHYTEQHYAISETQIMVIVQVHIRNLVWGTCSYTFVLTMARQLKHQL